MWVVYWLVAALWFWLASWISRNVSRAVWGPRSVLMKTMFGIPIILLVLLFIPEQYTLKQFFTIVSIWVIWYIPLLSFYKSLQYWDIWVLWPIANTSTVVTILLSIFLLWEMVTWLQWWAITIIIIWVIILGLNIRSLKSWISSKWLLFAIIAACWWWFMYFMFKIYTDITWPIVTALCIELWVLIASLVHCLYKKESLGILKYWKNVLYGGIAMWVLANIWWIALNYWFSVSTVPVVAAVFACSPLVSSLYWVLVYKEKLWMKEWLSIFAIIAWLIILSWIVW